MANGAAARRRALRSRPATSANRFSAAASASAAARSGSAPASSGCQLGAGLLRPGQQLLERRAAEPALGLRDPVEARLDLFQPVRLGLERLEERAQLQRRLAEPDLDVTQLAACTRQLGSDLLDRTERALGQRRKAGGPLAFVGRQRRGRRPALLPQAR